MSVILAIWEAEMGRLSVQGQSRKIVCEICPLQLQNNQMGWRCGSSGRMPALQVQSSKFNHNPPSTDHPKKEKKANKEQLLKELKNKSNM
jgi:hypothetical protein